MSPRRYLSIRVTTEQLEALRSMAKANGRSLQKETLLVLEQALERIQRERAKV